MARKKDGGYFDDPREGREARLAHIRTILPKFKDRIKELKDVFLERIQESEKHPHDRAGYIEQAKGLQAFAMGFVVRINALYSEAGLKDHATLENYWGGVELFPDVQPHLSKGVIAKGPIEWNAQTRKAAKEARKRNERLHRKEPGISMGTLKKIDDAAKRMGVGVIPTHRKRKDPFAIKRTDSETQRAAKLEGKERAVLTMAQLLSAQAARDERAGNRRQAEHTRNEVLKLLKEAGQAYGHAHRVKYPPGTKGPAAPKAIRSGPFRRKSTPRKP